MSSPTTPTNDTPIGDVIRKIAGLMRLAERAGTEEEAATAAGKAQSLMDQYSIDMAAVDKSKDNTAPKISSAAVTGNHGRWAMMDWKIKLISWVGDLNGVTAIRIGKRGLVLFGKTDKIQIVDYLTTYLCREVERLGIDVYWPQKGVYTGMPQRTYVQHFGIGAAHKISDRMKKERDQNVATATTINALMVVDKALVAESVAVAFPKLKTSTNRRRGTTAMHDGFEAGDTISWSKGLNPGANAPSQKSIT